MRLTFHEAVPTERCTRKDRHLVLKAVRRAILSGLAPDELPVERGARWMRLISRRASVR